MRIGVGLPNTVPDVPGRRLTEWAKQAESLGFSSLMTIGRLVFPTHDELIALTAAAAVTERIGLMVFGGNVAASFRRAAEHGLGWTAAGATPDEVRDLAARARAAWAAAGRSGEPRIWALTSFGLGPDVQATGERYLTAYYGDWGSGMAAGMPKDPAAISTTVEAFASVGVDELFFVPTNGELNQLDLLIAAVGTTTA